MGGGRRAARIAWLRTGIVPLDYPVPVAADWPELLAIVEEKVKPEHLAQKDKFGQEYWWHFLRARSELQSAIARQERVLAVSQAGRGSSPRRCSEQSERYVPRLALRSCASFVRHFHKKIRIEEPHKNAPI